MQGYFAANGITAICDAGHGFDADVSLIAAEAARRSGLPYARLVRPTWSIVPPAERAASVAQAAAMIPIGARVFAATGRGTSMAGPRIPRHRRWRCSDSLILIHWCAAT